MCEEFEKERMIVAMRTDHVGRLDARSHARTAVRVGLVLEYLY